MTQTLIPGASLTVQWLGLSIFTAGAQVQSLARELKSCKLSGTVGGKKQKKRPSSHTHQPSSAPGTEGGGKSICGSPCRSCPLISPPPLRMRLDWVRPTAPASPPTCLYPSGAWPPFWPGHCGLCLLPTLLPPSRFFLLPEETFCISDQLAFVAEQTSSELSGLIHQACVVSIVWVCSVGLAPWG